MDMQNQWKVVVTDYEYESLECEKKVLQEIRVNLLSCQCKTEADLIQQTRDADALLVQYAEINRTVLEKLEHCKVIVRYGIGVDNVDLKAATEFGIPVANVPDYGLQEVADHTIALLLSAARKIVQLNQSVRNGEWDYSLAKPLRRLQGRTLGLIAFGNIARLVATRAKGFGLKIKVFDPYLPKDKAEEYGAQIVDFQTLIRTSDFISIHCPATAETHHMFNQEVFKDMNPECILVNTARGSIIDEDALIEALENGYIAGAAIDVIEKEPIDLNSKLLHLDNLVITPHAAWYTEEAQESLQRCAAEEVVRVLTGKSAKHIVNPEYRNYSKR